MSYATSPVEQPLRSAESDLMDYSTLSVKDTLLDPLALEALAESLRHALDAIGYQAYQAEVLVKYRSLRVEISTRLPSGRQYSDLVNINLRLGCVVDGESCPNQAATLVIDRCASRDVVINGQLWSAVSQAELVAWAVGVAKKELPIVAERERLERTALAVDDIKDGSGGRFSALARGLSVKNTSGLRRVHPTDRSKPYRGALSVELDSQSLELRYRVVSPKSPLTVRQQELILEHSRSLALALDELNRSLAAC